MYHKTKKTWFHNAIIARVDRFLSFKASFCETENKIGANQLDLEFCFKKPPRALEVTPKSY